jgi:hypothetical protein
VKRAALGVALGLLARTAFAQGATATLDVVVRDAGGQALPAAIVELAERRATTDGRGHAFFFHVPPGTFTATARKTSLPPGSAAVEIRPGQRHSLTIVLGASSEPSTLPDAAPPRNGEIGAWLPAAALRSTPRPSDAWSIAGDVSGVVSDRVNVGGSETGQQSLLVAKGDAGAGATFMLDGFDVTDPAALGFSSIFPDVDALAGVAVRTSAFDVRVRTPGVHIDLLTRQPEAAAFAGEAHLRGTGDALEADNLPSELRSRPFRRARTESLFEAGAEGGGWARRDRLWLWAALARNALRQQTVSGHDERLRTTTLTAKGRLRLGDGHLSLLALRSEKIHDDRDTTTSTTPEARWRQAGPARLVGLEDRRMLGNASLVTRVSYLDAGFRLTPQGGPEANAFEDFRGIFRGSYTRFETRRRRLAAGAEVATRKRWRGLDHELLAGAGYDRSPVDTRVAWPGSQVVAFERENVFFRTFRLTGFALPTRGLDARTAHDRLGGYVQDAVSFGRVSLALGVRLERSSGHDRAAEVAANPVFPDLLPAVSYGGAAAAFRWLDVLPRLGATWDVLGDGSVTAHAGYAAYAGPLGAGDVGFAHPLRDVASLTYYWIDRDGDHAVDPGELDTLRGLLASTGVDPARPGVTTSPHRIDPGLRAPRTHEVMLGVDESLGAALHAGVRMSLRRSLHPLWRPLRNLTRGDYAATGRVEGRLFGRDYDVVFFAPASTSRIVPGNGRVLTNREGYHQDSVTVEAEARGRVGASLRWMLWGAWSDWREIFDEPERSVQDPTPTDAEPLQDSGPVAVRPGGLFRGDVFVNARWTGGADLDVRLPLRLDAAARLRLREGFPIPYVEVAGTGDPTSGAKSILVSPRLDAFRLPAVVLLDLRVARGFALGRGTLTAAVDAFNVLNRATELQVTRDVELPSLGRAREILRPRIVRLGLDYRF